MEDKDRPILETGIFPRLECEQNHKGEKTGVQVGLYLIHQELDWEDEFTGVVYDLDCLPNKMKVLVEEAIEEMDAELED